MPPGGGMRLEHRGTAGLPPRVHTGLTIRVAMAETEGDEREGDETDDEEHNLIVRFCTQNTQGTGAMT